MRRSLIACSMTVLALFGSGLQALAYQPPSPDMYGFGAPYSQIPGMGLSKRITSGVGVIGPRLSQIPQIPRMPDEVAPQSPEMDPGTAMMLNMLPPEARTVYLDSLQRIKELEVEKAAEQQAFQQELQTNLGYDDPGVYHDPDVWELIKEDPLADRAPTPRIPYPQEPQLVKVASLNTPTSDISAPPNILDVPLSDVLKPPPGSSAAYVAIASSGGVSNPQPRNPFTYTGREDDGTGLYYYRGRYYDPELEMFISQDPLGNAQRYVYGNPLRYTDPLGLDPNLNLVQHGPNASTKNNLIYDSAQKYVYKTTDWGGLAGVFGQPYTVVSHGTPDGQYVFDEYSRPLNAKQLAALILQDPNYVKHPGPIMLYGCNTGKGNNPIAQQVAEILRQKVTAPNSRQWWYPNKIGPVGPTLKNPSGKYVTFPYQQ